MPTLPNLVWEGKLSSLQLVPRIPFFPRSDYLEGPRYVHSPIPINVYLEDLEEYR
jgi:hypothetical protein